MPPSGEKPIKAAATTTTKDDAVSARQRLQGFVMLVLFLSAGFFYKVAMQTQYNYTDHAVSAGVSLKGGGGSGKGGSVSGGIAHVEVKKTVKKRNDKADARCQQICTTKRKLRFDQFNGHDLLNNQQLLQVMETSKVQTVKKLKSNDYYGEQYFKDIFELNPSTSTEGGDSEPTVDTTYGYNRYYRGIAPVIGDENEFTPFQGVGSPTSASDPTINTKHPNSNSYQLFKRKLMIKILQMQVAIRKEESNYMNCDCLNGDRALVNDQGERTELEEGEVVHINATSTYNKFTWVTGGHSASAGHGNLYNESYTAFFDRMMTPVLSNIGIELIARNYAMGGTPSGLEVSMCSEQIFGNDVDVQTYDYGMLDSRKNLGFMHYFYRSALANKLPTFIGFGTHGNGLRFARIKELNILGISAFQWNETEINDLKENTPDSSETTTSKEIIDSYPPFIKYFRCETGGYENNEPCKQEKYTTDFCPLRKGRTSWHPGWKNHALLGHAMGLFFIDMLINTIQEYAATTSTTATDGDSSTTAFDPEAMLAELQSEEELHFKEFKEYPLPAMAASMHEQKNKQAKPIPEDLDVENFFRGPSFCKTARTPAQTRYLGYLTDTPDKVGGPAVPQDETFELGITLAEADKTESNGVMRLVQGPHHNCPDAIVMPDYKDFFYAHSKDDWVSLTIPNNAEKKAYNYNPSTMKGTIALFKAGCDWGRCPPGDLDAEALAEGKYEMEVNGKKVKAVSLFGGWGGGHVVKYEDGTVRVPPNSDGLFEIRIRVLEPNSFFRLGSIVLY